MALHQSMFLSFSPLKTLFVVGFFSFFLVGCGGGSTTLFEAPPYQTVYQGGVIFSQTYNSNNDIVYIESWNTAPYLDTLIIQEKYNQGKGALAFSQEAMATLLDQKVKKLWREGILKDYTNQIQEKKIILYCYETPQSAVLLSYLISEGLSGTNLPLYITHLFLEKDDNTLMIWSYSTEEKKEQDRMKSALEKIQCI